MSIQGKLLRAIQEKKIEHLGSTRHRPLKLDIRFICATNKDLTYEIKHHRFRLDLFYRLNVVPINIPPLRQRQDDIPLLVDHFLEKLSKEKQTEKPKLSEKAVGQLMEHSWPGNVRELENVLERSMILSPGSFIDDINLCHDIDEPGKQKHSPVPSIDLSVPLKVMKEQAVSRIEAEYLSALLKKYDGSIKRTAAHADIDVRTIRRKMKTYGLDKWSFKTD